MNFIATTHRRGEKEAASEIYALLWELGDKNPKLEITDISGIIIGDTSLNPIEVSRTLREMVKKDPWSIRKVMRFIPIEKECKMDLDEISKIAHELANKIGKDESFKVIVEKRHCKIPSMEIIKKVAEPINRKVDLENPDWIVLIEIVKDKCGVSVIRPQDIFRSLEAKLSG